MRAHLHKTRLLKKKPTWTANVKRLKRFSVCFVYMQKKKPKPPTRHDPRNHEAAPPRIRLLSVEQAER